MDEFRISVRQLIAILEDYADLSDNIVPNTLMRLASRCEDLKVIRLTSPEDYLEKFELKGKK